VKLPEEIHETFKKYCASQERSMHGQIVWMVKKTLGLCKEEARRSDSQMAVGRIQEDSIRTPSEKAKKGASD